MDSGDVGVFHDITETEVPGVLTTPAAQLSVYDIINARYLVVDQAALAKIEEVYA